MGIIVLLKMFYGPIVGLSLIYAVYRKVKTDKWTIYPDLMTYVFHVSVGFIVSMVPFIIYAAANDLWHLVFYTWFEYPVRIIMAVRVHTESYLIKSIQWLLKTFAPLIAFAIIGFFSNRPKKSDELKRHLVIWIITGLLLIIVQQHWWEYHYLLLFIPMGILAAFGFDTLYAALKKTFVESSAKTLAFVIVFFTAFVFVYPILNVKTKFMNLMREGFAVEKENRVNYKKYNWGQYSRAMEQTAFLKDPNSKPGKIFVCGNPYYYLLSGRKEAISLNGWLLEAYLPEQRKVLAREIDQKKPIYIFISAAYLPIVSNYYQDFNKVLNKKYNLLRKSRVGNWYVIVDGEKVSDII
jgi:hypothetical protein